MGDALELTADDAPANPTIVGVAESTTVRTYPVAAGPLGAFGVDVGSSTRGWSTAGRGLVGRRCASSTASAPSWPRGGDRRPAAVLGDPARGAAELSTDDTTLAVIALIAVMALIEVVLLAGPAFAVSARKQQRSLALMAATGGTPKQSRRVIVAGAVVLGQRGRSGRGRARHRDRAAAATAAPVAVRQLVRAVRDPVAAPGRRGRLRDAQRVPGRHGPGPPRLRAGRRRGAGRAPRRPGAVPEVAPARPGAARCRHRRGGVRRRPGCRRRVRDRGAAPSRPCSG